MSATVLSDRESLETVVAAEPTSLLGSSHGELVLRMANGPHAGRVLRLSSAKCSIGSAADCTLRLRGAGLDPVHCVIFRGARQTIVRRWSGDTRLNDRRFDDMPLHHGDRLTLGAVEIQVVDVGGAVREAAQSARRVDLELTTATARLERLTERLDLANRQGRRRLRAVLAKLRKYQLRLTEVDGRRSRLQQEQDQLRTERSQLQAAQEAVERRRVELELEVRRLSDCDETATSRRAELDRRATQLHERETQSSARDRELSDRSASLHAQAAELASREQVIERRAAQLAEGGRALDVRETTLNAQIADLRRQADDLAGRESQVAARCEALKNHWTVLTERETKLERDWAALNERERALAEVATPVASAPTVVIDPAAVERAEKLQAALNEARAELAAVQNEQTRRETALQERQAAAESESSARRAAVEAEATEVAARRATVELAARTVARWSALVEEWSSAASVAAAPVNVAETSGEETAAALEQAERRLLENRLDLEKLEAEMKTWRDEARLWKSRFDEQSCTPAPLLAVQPEADATIDEPMLESVERSEIEPEPEAFAPSHDEMSEESTTAPETIEANDVTEATPVQEGKSESAADVLRRLGLAVALEEESAVPVAVSPSAAPLSPPAAPEAAAIPTAAESHHEGDESLDVYMQQLFQRLGVNQGAAPAPEAAPQATPVAVQKTEASQAEAAAAPAAPLPLLQPGEFKARSSAAERRSDLTALRELANFQAKTAITKHQITRKSTNSKGKRTIGVLSLGLGLYSSWSYWMLNYDPAKYGVGCGLGVAALYLLQSIGLKYSAKKSKRSLDDVIQKSTERGNVKPEGAE